MENKYDEARNILEKYNQKHLLSQYDKLDDCKKEYLLNQILNIDFEQINELSVSYTHLTLPTSARV